MSYEVFKVVSTGLGADDHHALFVKTETQDNSGGGNIFHVVGSVLNGMTYECKSTPDPQLDMTYQSRKFLGTVSVTNYCRIEQICKTIPAPQKQFDGFRRISASVPLRHCQHWLADVIQALINEGILEEQQENYDSLFVGEVQDSNKVEQIFGCKVLENCFPKSI